VTELERRRRVGRIIFYVYFFFALFIFLWRVSFSFKLHSYLNEKRPLVRSASILKGVFPLLHLVKKS
jgi:hypothetical protein